MRFRFSRYTDETITTSLHYLRAQIIRENLDGLEHVEALLRLRGCDPDAVRVPPAREHLFKPGEVRRYVLEAHRDGVTDRAAITERILAAKGLPADRRVRVRAAVAQACRGLRRSGLAPKGQHR